MELSRSSLIKISVPDIKSIIHAAEDLSEDLKNVLSSDAFVIIGNEKADISVSIDKSSRMSPETFKLSADENSCKITASDERGAVYGLYRLSSEYLGVDPLSYWTGLSPVTRESVLISGEYRSPVPAFTYRGWFINDEDLLRSFPAEEPGPYINPGLYRKIFSTMNRLGINTLIPGTLLDVMDEEEEKIIPLAAEYGLNICFHHIETLGVMAGYQFRRYCRDKQKKNVTYSWVKNPDLLEEVWDRYAEKLASYGNIIWTLGYRGAHDEPFWENESDAPEDAAGRGEIICSAIRKQIEIVRRYDKSPSFVINLWDEGRVLYDKGALCLPDEAVVVFSDDGRTQTFCADFHKSKNGLKNGGIYYHLQFSTTGPMTVEENPPEKIAFNLKQALEKDFTEFSVVNVGNIKPYIYGLRQTASMLFEGESFSLDEFNNGFFGYYFGNEAEKVKALYYLYYSAHINIDPEHEVPFFRLFLDGCHKALQEGLAEMIREEKTDNDFFLESFRWLMVRMSLLSKSEDEIENRSDHADTAIWKYKSKHEFFEYISAELKESIDKFDGLLKNIEDVIDSSENKDAVSLLKGHLYLNALTLRTLTFRSLYMIKTVKEIENQNIRQARLRLSEIIVCIKAFIAKRDCLCRGKWSSWYTGEQKINFRELLEESRRLRTSL
ncbi:MAG: glycosyl hydrolase 115 family protein [Fibrobacterota bacterium]